MMIRHMIQSAPKTALLALGIIALSACQTSGTTRHTDAVNRSSVELVRLPFEIRPEADGTDTLSAQSAVSMHAFLTSVNAGYGDIIMLDAPSATPKRLEAIQEFLKERGLTFGGVAPLGTAPSEQGVMLYVERYQVTVPNCGVWPADNASIAPNNAAPFHGCATTATLNLMVANPRDLVAGQNGRANAQAAVSAVNGLSQPASTGPRVTFSVEGLNEIAPTNTNSSGSN
ncbi:CpaD family pilus assembly lipoprotein [Kordiimonas laminariae]|uniref:CpaD family pilus assembly lipoprotein n=1 Tax=Kordiimonas laminariae TaxID=2917717 RepID=UPI001FF33F07|nr:CpaD family pilus assembly lipoprotein [Kordiimonas laminariae]MCK0068199.1 CpaD family pilus assembly protein [Kordiimonas laminariae]